MNYSTDYFNPENQQLYPQLTLNFEEYARFVTMCHFIDVKLQGSWSSFLFVGNSLMPDNIALDNQIISVKTIHDVKVLEKFYYKIHFKYLEEKLNGLTENVSNSNNLLKKRINNLIPPPPYIPFHLKSLNWEDVKEYTYDNYKKKVEIVNCEHCRQYHNNDHKPVITSRS